jgi:uncharacterized membrane protein
MIAANRNLPKNVLMGLAVVGWLVVLYLAYVVGNDSWRRTVLVLIEVTKGLPELDPFNQRYVDHPWLTMMHTIPGVLFVILGPMQFMSPIRKHAPRMHRIFGRVYLTIAMFSAIIAIAITFVFPIWGMTINQLLTLSLGIWMIFSLSKAFTYIRARKIPLHREWMIRGFTAGISVGWFRVILNDALLRNGVEFTEAWNIALVVSLPTALMVSEFWIWATKPKKKAQPSVPSADLATGQ